MAKNKNTNWFNFEYFSVWREIPILFFVELFRREGAKNMNGNILIINPCLIGEFAATIPAIYDFIKNHPTKKVDILVTPALKTLASKIVGINKVFVTKSAYVGRATDKVDFKNQVFGSYAQMIFLRISELSYLTTFNIKGSEVKTSFHEFFDHVMHLIKCQITGRYPRSWSTLNFRILGGQAKDIPATEMLKFEPADFEKLKTLDVLNDKRKKIIIHVGTKWQMKRWPKERWLELLEKVNKLGDFQFIFVGGNDDIPDYEYISSHLSFKVDSLINKTTVSDLTLIMKQAYYFMGIDSGPSNLAHLVDLRSLTIYGPGPHMYMPTHPDDIIFDKTNGRGMFQLFFKVKNSYINRITVDEVYQAFKNIQPKLKNK